MLTEHCNKDFALCIASKRNSFYNWMLKTCSGRQKLHAAIQLVPIFLHLDCTRSFAEPLIAFLLYESAVGGGQLTRASSLLRERVLPSLYGARAPNWLLPPSYGRVGAQQREQKYRKYWAVPS